MGVFREMPDYVFDDFVMSDKGFFQKELNKILKQNPNADEDDVAEQFSDWVKINWKLKVLEVNPSDFTKDNLKNMIRRKFGDANPGKIPNDEKRIAFQRNLAKKLKPGTNEPVIVLNKGSQYRLLEGWKLRNGPKHHMGPKRPTVGPRKQPGAITSLTGTISGPKMFEAPRPRGARRDVRRVNYYYTLSC